MSTTPADVRRALGYALAKQIPTVYAVQSDYGELVLDEAMRRAVQRALEPLIKKRLQRLALSSPSPSHPHQKTPEE